MRHIFDVLIKEKNYGVFDIEAKEHDSQNGEPKTWWLYFSDKLPDGIYPPIDSEHWKPWTDSISRRVWDFKIKQRVSTKYKWDELRFRTSTSIEMFCNGKKVYEFGTTGGDRGISFAFAKIQYLMVVLGEHPFNFFEPEKENGRKIFWMGLPAFVVSREENHEIRIRPDYSIIPKEEWWKQLKLRETKIGKYGDDDFKEITDEETEDYMRDDLINWGDAFSDQHIDWFRK